MQCAIAVAALWGVLVFKEIQGKQIIVMGISAVIVLGGAVLLALSKK
jgi:glucose uptake protein GlcU